MKILFIDSTQDWIHVALIESIENQLPLITKFELFEMAPKESSFRLVAEIKNAMIQNSWIKPDRIVCLTGPGSFTGIRISVSTGRNLSQLWKIPILGVDSLEAYTLSFQQTYSKNVMLALDGKQNKWYFGMRNQHEYLGSYDLEEKQIEERILEFRSTEDIYFFSGKKPECFPFQSIKIEETLLKSMPIVNILHSQLKELEFQTSNYKSLLPNYIRGSYVETNKK